MPRLMRMWVGRRRSIGNLAIPGIVLLVGWALSGWLYVYLEHASANYDESLFEKIIASVDARITDRFVTYEQALWGAAGHLAADENISPKDWHIYVGRLHLFEKYPGTTATLIVQPVHHENLDTFVQMRRRRGLPDFTPHRIPTGVPESLPEHFLVVCAEPAAVAIQAIGADLAGDPLRRIAAERSRDSGTAVLAKHSQLGDSSGNGLQLFVPAYREGASLATVDDRRKALIAWVTVALRADTFLRSVLSDIPEIINLQVDDGAPGGLFFSSTPRLNDQTPERFTYLTLGGRTWTLGWRRRSSFPYVSRTPVTWATGCTALLSLLLAGLATTLQMAKRDATDRLELIQSVLTLGTWEFDARCGVIYCSEQFSRLYGAAECRNRLSLQEWLSCVHPEDRDAIMADFRRGNTIDRQYRVVWPDGSTHWLHRKAVVLSDADKRPIWVVGVDFDVTEMKQLQTQLAQAQKLESIGQLAAGIAHEINTPIQYIGDNAKFLEDSVKELIALSRDRTVIPGESHTGAPALQPPEPQDPNLEYLRVEVPKAFGQLLEGVEQVARIVRAMKDFSHPGPAEMIAIDLNRAIESTILVSRNEWKYVAELTTDFQEDLPPVECISGELNQVILNLIVNAAHAIGDVVKDTGRRGSIHISTALRESVVEVRISDTGGGIPPAIQSKVFEPFFTTKPVGKGTGQGLAIAYAVIVQKHKGRLTFESQPHRGTTFVIQLPLVHELEVA